MAPTGRPLPSRLLFVADASHAPGPAGAESGLTVLVRRAFQAGVRFMELRRPRPLGDGPVPGSAQLLEEIEACLAAAPGATILVNDRVDLALLSGAAGAHVGQDDLPPGSARALLGPGAWLGLSTHEAAQVRAAAHEPVDYIGLGPVFASRTKSGHAELLGHEGFQAACAGATHPVIAIGGIDAEAAARLLDAGAAGVAVARALSEGDVVVNARRLLQAVGES